VEEATIDIIARRFLDGHRVENTTDGELATACNRIIQQAAHLSYREAVAVARTFLRRSTQASPILQIAALRAMARTLHMGGSHAKALGYYLRARKLCQRDPLSRARIDRALIDVYMYVGDFSRARRAARSALTAFERKAATDDLAQTWVNLGNLLHRQDRHLEAEALYRQAAEHFAATGDRLATARCHYNRANTLVQLFDFTTAEKLYRSATTEYENAGYELEACDARYGLAWLWMLSGKFHLALLELSACEKAYSLGGDRRGEALCILDRAEVYLGLGLHQDALQASQIAARRFRRLQLRYEVSKAELFHGQAALALGKKTAARRSLLMAEKGFAKEQNQGFLGATRLLAADLAGRDQQGRDADLAAARQRFSRAQLPYWEAMADLRVAMDSRHSSQALHRLSKNRAVRWVPHLYALWQIAIGDQAYRRNDIVEARRRWTMAADRMDAVRTQLPPIELRSAYGRKQALPHPRLVAATLGHDPIEASVWSERYKTAGLWAPLAKGGITHAARRSAQESLERLASHVALLTRPQWNSPGTQRTAMAVPSRVTMGLQRQVREEILALEKDHDGAAPSMDDLKRLIASISKKMPVVQFHTQDEDICAFVHRCGYTTMRRFYGGRTRLAGNIEKWRFILEGELLRNNHDPAISVAERLLWSDIGAWLWAPLGIDAGGREVLIIPDGELANLPWPALIVNQVPLVEQYRFILSPSLRHFGAASRIRCRSQRIEVFRGAADDLPQADREIAALKTWAGKSLTVHNPCRRESWLSQGESFIWHYVGHAQLRADNPFYSCLHLADGPLFAADFRLRSCRANLVTLSACRSGEQVALPGEEATGLVRSLLEMGARNVIAGLWPVSDDSAALWMETFYDGLFTGAGILDALRRASLTVREKFPSAYHWAAFALSGAGDLGGSYER